MNDQQEDERRQSAPDADGERFLLGGNNGDAGDGWREEAEAVISDVKSFVNSISVSDVLPCNESGVYMNLETKEASRYTIELSIAGFRIRGLSFDSLDADAASTNQCFETPYALLDVISPAYRECFSGALADKLSQLLPKPT